MPAGSDALPLPAGIDATPLLDLLDAGSSPGPAATRAVSQLLRAVGPTDAVRPLDVDPDCTMLLIPGRRDVVATARRYVSLVAADHPPARGRQDEVRVAVSEAVANAVEHAHRGGTPGPLLLLVCADDQQLRVVVGDDGRWDDSPPEPHRGRGTSLMTALSDSFSRYSDAHGTVVVLSFGAPEAPRPN